MNSPNLHIEELVGSSADRVGSPLVTITSKRAESRTLDWFLAALSEPRSIDQVEMIEEAAKSIWRDVLLGQNRSLEDVRASMAFFHRIGFLFKYKPYGVKIASPFGYSIFDLNEGQGFSFHRHTLHKIEAFHILKATSASFVYLSTLNEWEEGGRGAVEKWIAGRERIPKSAYVYEPTAGDVIHVRHPNEVHTAIGRCTIEEFATCSIDAVTRLLDQNQGHTAVLPRSHPDFVTTLGGLDTLPRRQVSRDPEGWTSRAMRRDGLIDAKGKLSGRRLSLATTTPSFKGVTRAGQITVIAILRGSVSAEAVGRQWKLATGELLVVPPQRGYQLQSTDEAIVVTNTVAAALAME
jgi:hypothetical protein